VTVTADLAAACEELADLFPHLADALERDNTGETTARTWHGRVVVNADVLQAAVTLAREIPATTTMACAQLGEPSPPRDLTTCLRQLPRLAERLHTMGKPDHITGTVYRWLPLTKRALGLRKPDTVLPHPCPWSATMPDDHPGRERLILVGAEGHLRQDRHGYRVEWVLAGRIYCPDCGAAWSQAEWRLLEHILEQAAAESARISA
jgi:hypothetical protein